MRAISRIGLAGLLAVLAAGPVGAQRPGPGPTPGSLLDPNAVRLEQRLGNEVPAGLHFRDEHGRAVRLHDYFQEKPVMLVLIQYRCTVLCHEQMNVLLESLRQIDFTPGKEFRLLVVSIDPRETPALAAEVQRGYVEAYGRPEAAAGWHCLTGSEETIRQLADAVGFHFVYDRSTGQFAHPDGVILLTPSGMVTRYFFRLEYPPRDLRYGLIDASESRIGTPLDALAIRCFRYDPSRGVYSLAVEELTRWSFALFTVFLAAALIVAARRERRKASPVPGGE